MKPFIHFDEAIQGAVALCAEPIRDIGKLLLVVDIQGRIRVIYWNAAKRTSDLAEWDERITGACGDWWTGEKIAASELQGSLRNVWDQAWEEAEPQREKHFRILNRHRSRTAWFESTDEPLWMASKKSPTILAFYSFKGGLGRSTALASFAIQRARLGERVCIVDFDLDAPGIGRFLSADAKGNMSPWGTVDFLLESKMKGRRLEDYYHRCDRVSGEGQIFVVPSGMIDKHYAGKLARIDFDDEHGMARDGLKTLLKELKKELRPRWILVDARTGFSEPAGILMSGFAHLHVLIGSTSEQSWQGLSHIITRLGKMRIRRERAQAEVVMVQTMAPASGAPLEAAKRAFGARSLEIFSDLYYIADEIDSPNEIAWDIHDAETSDAPHQAVTIPYKPLLADFRDVEEIAHILEDREFKEMAERIAERFMTESEE